MRLISTCRNRMSLLSGSHTDDGSTLSYQEIREVASPPPEETSLPEAINTASLRRLRALLKCITDSNPQAHDRASSFLLKPITGTNKKRKARETCKNCYEEYDVWENEMGACVFHEGGKEVNDSDGFWDDHDPHHGEPEDLEDEPGYDEGFQWSCCQEPIGAEGCVRSRHLPKDAHKKKSRVDVASLTD